jgi:hypothetical protein
MQSCTTHQLLESQIVETCCCVADSCRLVRRAKALFAGNCFMLLLVLGVLCRNAGGAAAVRMVSTVQGTPRPGEYTHALHYLYFSFYVSPSQGDSM